MPTTASTSPKAERNRAPAACSTCGYNLHGLPETHYRCPECGTQYVSSSRQIPVFDPFGLETLPPLRDRLEGIGRRLLKLLLFALIVVVFAMLAVCLEKGAKMAY